MILSNQMAGACVQAVQARRPPSRAHDNSNT